MKVYYLHPDASMSALFTPKELLDEAMQDAEKLLFWCHWHCDRVVVGDESAKLVDENPHTYWVSSSTYHYAWVYEYWLTCLMLSRKESPYVDVLAKKPFNMLKRGFKVPYTLACTMTDKDKVIPENISWLGLEEL